jgi:hypothetical protein
MAKDARRGINPNIKFFGGVFGVGVVMLLSTVMLARSDGGPINVAAIISSSNQERAASGDTSAPTPVPKPSGNNDLPFGGLVGQGDAPGTRPAPPPAVESAATIEEEPATTTDVEATEESVVEETATEEVGETTDDGAE